MVVGLIESGLQDAWHVSNAQEFTQYPVAAGITLKLKVYNANGQFDKQTAAFHQFSADPTVNVIVLDALQASGYDAALKEARDAGKIVVVEGVRIDADPLLYATYVGSDFEAEGEKAGKAVCDLLANSPKKNVAEISETADTAAQADRSAGFRKAMTACRIVIPDSSPSATGSSGSESRAVVAAWLKQTHDIQGIYAHSEDDAFGAIAAIKAAGLKPGKDIQIVATGSVTCEALGYLRSAELGAEIETNPLLAPQVYDAALRALNREPDLPKWIRSQEGMFFASQGPAALWSSSCPGLNPGATPWIHSSY
jgi:ABC-type sugar transport system substrate-binding protein